MLQATKSRWFCVAVLRSLLCFLCLCAGPWAHATEDEDLTRAIAQDNPRAMGQLLWQGFAPNTPNAQGEYALIKALQAGAFQVAQRLLQHPHIRVEVRNAQDESPLMLAALKGQLALCQTLLAQDADVNKPGWAALHYAAASGNAEVISLLLAHYAYIDAASPNGSTPLMMAAMYGSTEAVRTLLEAGADPTLKNQKGLSALDFAQAADRNAAQELIANAIRARQSSGQW